MEIILTIIPLLFVLLPGQIGTTTLDSIDELGSTGMLKISLMK